MNYNDTRNDKRTIREKQMQKIDDTATIEFADSVIDTFCPPVAEAVGNYGGLMVGLVRTRRISPGPMARREYARANRLEEENIRLRTEKGMTTINVTPGATIVVKRPPRTDKGKTHNKTSRGWKSQMDVAADFSKKAKKLGDRWYGKVTNERVKDWERRYPNETKREPKSGYHAGLRRTSNPTPEVKNEYWEAASNWNEYWRLHNEAFSEWLKANPKGDHALFLKTWERPGKTIHRNDTDKTVRYGTETSFMDSLDDGTFDGDKD